MLQKVKILPTIVSNLANIGQKMLRQRRSVSHKRKKKQKGKNYISLGFSTLTITIMPKQISLEEKQNTKYFTNYKLFKMLYNVFSKSVS